MEVWLRGPIPEIPALLNPVAHALLQVGEELDAALAEFPETLLWLRPASVASVGFHLQHIAGVLDRLFTYARGEALSAAQLEYLRGEGSGRATKAELVATLHRQVESAIAELRTMDVATLTQPRTVGRDRLPSTVLGLLVHAAEHAQRHAGQLLVTVRVSISGFTDSESENPE